MSDRPWLCPEPRCTPFFNLKSKGVDLTVPTPGESFWCWGAMEQPVTFNYDGVEHVNDCNACRYTPLKGVIRFQENPDDWWAQEHAYRRIQEKYAAHKAERES